MAASKNVIVGIEQLERRLKALEAIPQGDEIRKIFRTAAFIGENAVWAQVPVGKTGNLRKGVKSGELARPEIGGYVGVRAKHAHLLEAGTRERVQKKTGRRTGKGPATQFFSKSIATARRRFRPYIIDELQNLVVKESQS